MAEAQRAGRMSERRVPGEGTGKVLPWAAAAAAAAPHLHPAHACAQHARTGLANSFKEMNSRGSRSMLKAKPKYRETVSCIPLYVLSFTAGTEGSRPKSWAATFQRAKDSSSLATGMPCRSEDFRSSPYWPPRCSCPQSMCGSSVGKSSRGGYQWERPAAARAAGRRPPATAGAATAAAGGEVNCSAGAGGRRGGATAAAPAAVRREAGCVGAAEGGHGGGRCGAAAAAPWPP